MKFIKTLLKAITLFLVLKLNSYAYNIKKKYNYDKFDNNIYTLVFSNMRGFNTVQNIIHNRSRSKTLIK